MQRESFMIKQFFAVIRNYLCNYWDIVNSFNPCYLSITDRILAKVKINGRDY